MNSQVDPLQTQPQMNEVVIRTRENGPLVITGPVTIIDHQYSRFDLPPGENIALCRCGASQNKPFCDGAHRRCGFVATELATDRNSPDASP
ncbi:CDGSH iron-sulfur domain-containing protein [Planctopirus ephydatiae]|uniref:CDGSH iron-sulfur domain-containing protein n=1 Tax=Planctopirus ephydatiae TaxID=2528019 RepID=UPI00119DD6F0|nr:CDGSH iron-sulfur domain-containing protein [Planctopirus ephydatiae]